jgi:hypothetical protein
MFDFVFKHSMAVNLVHIHLPVKSYLSQRYYNLQIKSNVYAMILTGTLFNSMFEIKVDLTTDSLSKDPQLRLKKLQKYNTAIYVPYFNLNKNTPCNNMMTMSTH